MNLSQRRAGALMVLAALGFSAVFGYLASTFGYPEVLDRPAAEVLPALVAGGWRLRLAWAVYAALPIALIAASWLLRDSGASRMSSAAGVLSGVAMTMGLVRWSTLQWSLGEAWAGASGEARAALAARFELLNVVLGRVVGEFLGEVLLAAWFVGVGLAFRARWSGRAAVGLGALLAAGALRNVAPVQAVTEMTNLLLPLVLVWLGVSLWRRPAQVIG